MAVESSTMDGALEAKRAGNEHFGRQEWDDAAARYGDGIAALAALEGGGEMSSIEAFAVHATLCSNLAAARLAVGDGSKAFEVTDGLLGRLPAARAALGGKVKAAFNAAVEHAAGQTGGGSSATLASGWLIPPHILSKVLHRRAMARVALCREEAKQLDDATLMDHVGWAKRAWDTLTHAASDCDAAATTAALAGVADDVRAIAELRQRIAGNEVGIGVLPESAAKRVGPHVTWRLRSSWCSGVGVELAPGPSLHDLSTAGVAADAVVAHGEDLSSLEDGADEERGTSGRTIVEAGTVLLQDLPVFTATSSDGAMGILGHLTDALRNRSGPLYLALLSLLAGLTDQIELLPKQDPVDLARLAWGVWGRTRASYEFRMACDEDDELQSTPALYSVLPFVEHSCEPNCVLRYDDVTRSASLVALRPMTFGTKLTVAVVHPLASVAQKLPFFISTAATLAGSVLAGHGRGEPSGPRCLCDSCRATGIVASEAEAVTCPFCGATSAPLAAVVPTATNDTEDGKNSVAAVVRHTCASCARQLPVDDYTRSVHAKTAEAQRYVSSGDGMSGARLLLAVEDGAKMLGPRHRLRFHLLLGALSAGFSCAAQVAHVRVLKGAADRAVELAQALLPKLWPETVGLLMHRAMLEGIAARINQRDSGGDTQQQQQAYDIQGLQRHNGEGLAVAYGAMCEAFELYGASRVDAAAKEDIAAFLGHYATEFEGIGAVDLPSLQLFMTLATSS